MTKTHPDHSMLVSPPSREPLLLHCCCAPCSGGIIESLRETGLTFSVLFYNPNIYPRQEYLRRKDENKRFADQCGIPFVDLDEGVAEWEERTQGLDAEPERGSRCTRCFDLRLERTASYARQHGFAVFATSLGISRWKDLQQVNQAGARAAALYPGLTFWDANWRKQGGVQRQALVARREAFYRQQYCGCRHSRRAAESRRQRRVGE